MKLKYNWNEFFLYNLCRSKKSTLHIFRLQQLLSCSQDLSTNSETTNEKFSKFITNLVHMYNFYHCTCYCQNQSDWLNNFWKLRFGSFGIGLWIRWARHSMVFEHPWFLMCRLSNVGLSQCLNIFLQICPILIELN